MAHMYHIFIRSPALENNKAYIITHVTNAVPLFSGLDQDRVNPVSFARLLFAGRIVSQ